MKQVSVVIVGGGARGAGYSQYIKEHPEQATLVGVVEPRDFHRNQIAADGQIPAENVLTDWRQLADRPRLADAAIISTPDALHVEPTVALAAKGYHILLEKPMAPTEPDCFRVHAAIKQAGVLLAVAHVLRYADYTVKLKSLLDAGLIGRLVDVQHLEPVGYWHQAHSFVRGNFGNSKTSSPMLLAKSCHDVDWLLHVMGSPCRRVSSFGSLTHFRRDCKPAHAGDATRCTACAYEPQCPYSAIKIYLQRIKNGYRGWPVDMVSPEQTEESMRLALERGPYGRCVYECDNDVVDHQVVNMEFDGGLTAAFTMTAFCAGGGRKTRLFGTRGELFIDGGDQIEHYDFLTDQRTTIDARPAGGAHGGGDHGLMEAFLTAVATGDASRILTGPDETLESHRMVFAAERSRNEGRVVEL